MATTRQSRPVARTAATTRARLAGRAMIICGLLIIQFFLGMITNLYVTIPASHPGAGAKDFFAGAPDALSWAVGTGPAWLATHAALGMFLGLASIGFIIAAARARDRMWTWLSTAGCLIIIGAAFNGTSFVMYNHDFSSLIMSGLFALALSCYLAGIYYSGRRSR